MSALEKARQLEQQRWEVLAAGVEEAIQRAEATVQELRELVDEQLKDLRACKRASGQQQPVD